MKLIIFILTFLFCSCACPESTNVTNTNSRNTNANDIIVYTNKCYRIKDGIYGTQTYLYEVELEGHLYWINQWNDSRLMHAPHCPCHNTVDVVPETTTTETFNYTYF